MVAEIAVALWVPVTSPLNEPVKVAALPDTLPVTLPVSGPLNVPSTIPVNVGLSRFAFNLLLLSSLLKADKIVSSADSRLPAPET